MHAWGKIFPSVTVPCSFLKAASWLGKLKLKEKERGREEILVIANLLVCYWQNSSPSLFCAALLFRFVSFPSSVRWLEQEETSLPQYNYSLQADRYVILLKHLHEENAKLCTLALYFNYCSLILKILLLNLCERKMEIDSFYAVSQHGQI